MNNGGMKMKKTAVTLALLAGLLGTGGCAKIDNCTIEETVVTELTLKVGEYGSCGLVDPGLKGGLKYAGMSDKDIFTVVKSYTHTAYNLYFPVETKELEEGFIVLEVTPEYLKLECE
jgi:hypothetical protein